jgi:hypothetical protein
MEAQAEDLFGTKPFLQQRPVTGRPDSQNAIVAPEAIHIRLKTVLGQKDVGQKDNRSFVFDQLSSGGMQPEKYSHFG